MSPASNPLATSPAVATARTAGQTSLPAALIVLGDAFGWLSWSAAQTAAVLALATIASAYVQKIIEARKGRALGG